MKEKSRVQIFANSILAIISLFALLPFVLLVISSFTDNSWAASNGFTFFPREWGADAYLYLANKWEVIGKSYIMTIVVTIIGTSLSLIITSMFAYGLSNDRLPGRKIIRFLVIFTMLFNGGLVATYYTYVSIFHLRNTIWALILPGLLMNAFNIILVMNYYKNSIPKSLLEAAKLDGANEFKIFFKIVMPLSVPILATIGLMTGIAYWNDWQNGLYYLTERGGSDLFTIQVVLNSINENVNFLASNAGSTLTNVSEMPTVTARMAIAVIGILPIMIAYPFFQRYFVKGITLGGIKE